MFSDPVLQRLPLAGTNPQGYNTHLSQKICKIASATMQIALLVLAGLAIANKIPMPWGITALGIIAPVRWFATCYGNSQLSQKQLVFEALSALAIYAIASVGIIRLLPPQTVGIAVASIAAGTMILNHTTGKTPFEEKREKQQSCLLTAIDHCIGLTRDLTFVAHSRIMGLFHQYDYSQNISDQQNADALCVMVHGLKGSPTDFDDYRYDFEHLEGKTITCFQPKVTKLGDCSLEEAASGIREEIRRWTQRHPHQPVLLIGVSNGARIVGSVAAQLKKEGVTNRMHVSCIAGPFSGTKIVNGPTWSSTLQSGWRLAIGKLFDPKVQEELSWESAFSQTVIHDMQEAVQRGGLIYDFYATQSDSRIIPYQSAFPLVEGSHYFLTSGEGHGSIVRAAEQPIVDRSRSFLG